MDIYAKAQIAANRINAEAGWEILRMRTQRPNRAGGPLQLAELQDFATKHPGWYDVRALYLAIRKSEPAKGESIASGRAMAQQGWARRRVGPQSLWHMDNATRAGVA